MCCRSGESSATAYSQSNRTQMGAELISHFILSALGGALWKERSASRLSLYQLNVPRNCIDRGLLAGPVACPNVVLWIFITGILLLLELFTVPRPQSG